MINAPATRCSRDGVRAAPQESQNLASGRFNASQAGHRGLNCAPHLSQNLAVSRLSAPHFEQRIFPVSSAFRLCTWPQALACDLLHEQPPTSAGAIFRPCLAGFCRIYSIFSSSSAPCLNDVVEAIDQPDAIARFPAIDRPEITEVVATRFFLSHGLSLREEHRLKPVVTQSRWTTHRATPWPV